MGITSILLGCALALVGGEVLVRFLAPQAYLYPRWRSSADYGHVLFADTRMRHSMPGRFEYQYSINSLGYRGPRVPISNHYDLQQIVVLGDSYSFGTGVNDGQEFPAVMQRRMGDRAAVVNLSVGGWGLPQEIRRFYEFGILYQPEIVILQFCSNDISDGLLHAVTRVDRDRFVFMPTGNQSGWLRAYLSGSAVQRSQLYNFLRQFLYRRFEDANKVEARVLHAARNAVRGALTPEEQGYLDLLGPFATDLRRRGIDLLMISVNGQLEQFPALSGKIRQMDRGGELHYLDVRPWFEGISDYESPEGHLWGAKAHAILGENLAREILAGQRAVAQ